LQLKPDGLGEKLKEPVPEPVPKRDNKLSLVKASDQSGSIQNNQDGQKEKGSQFTPILEFLKKKKASQKTNSGALSKRGIAFRRYQESVNLDSKIKSLLEPMILDLTL
jgi:hypothetical protein